MAIDTSGYPFKGLKDLVEILQKEGFDATDIVFRGQVGLQVTEPGKTMPDFFPLWELNENPDLVERRAFKAIKAKRPPGWSPLKGENRP